VSGLNDVQQENWWDSIDIGGSDVLQNGTRIFGNRNVGDLGRCNLQTPGRLAYHPRVCVVQRWYARTNIVAPHYDDFSDAKEALAQWASCTYAGLQLGDRGKWRLPLCDLLLRQPASGVQDPWPLIVDPKDNVMVNLDWYDGTAMDVMTQLGQQRNANMFQPIRIWIHLEGVSVHMRDRADKHDDVAHHLINTVLTATKQRKSVEDAIADWLLGQIETADDEAKAQLHGVRDGIMEGRHIR
jgi:hypothetical protein